MGAETALVSFAEPENVWQDEIGALRARLRTDPEAQPALLARLHEAHAAYRERGADAVVRMRAWALLALAEGAWSKDLERYVLEELDNGRDAYLIGVAAAVLRRAASPDARFAPFLLRALNIIRWHDDAIQLASYGGYATGGASTTAVREILATLEWLGPLGSVAFDSVDALSKHAAAWPVRTRVQLTRTLTALRRQPSAAAEVSCCAVPLSPPPSAASIKPVALADVELEDHDGRRLRFGEFFSGRPALLTFFYTRCNNPRKCSATIERMGKLQAALRSAGLFDRVRTASLTYDPAYDQTSLLRAYGASRGWQFDDNHRLLRTVGDFAPVGEALELGVNFVSSIVNRHRLEALVFRPDGRIVGSIEQIAWVVDDTVQRLRSLMSAEH